MTGNKGSRSKSFSVFLFLSLKNNKIIIKKLKKPGLSILVTNPLFPLFFFSGVKPLLLFIALPSSDSIQIRSLWMNHPSVALVYKVCLFMIIIKFYVHKIGNEDRKWTSGVKFAEDRKITEIFSKCIVCCIHYTCITPNSLYSILLFFNLLILVLWPPLTGI